MTEVDVAAAELRAARARRRARIATGFGLALVAIMLAVVLGLLVGQQAALTRATEEHARIAAQQLGEQKARSTATRKALDELERFMRRELAQLEQRLRGLRFVIEREGGDRVVVRTVVVRSTATARPAPVCSPARASRCR